MDTLKDDGIENLLKMVKSKTVQKIFIIRVITTIEEFFGDIFNSSVSETIEIFPGAFSDLKSAKACVRTLDVAAGLEINRRQHENISIEHEILVLCLLKS